MKGNKTRGLNYQSYQKWPTLATQINNIPETPEINNPAKIQIDKTKVALLCVIILQSIIILKTNK